MASADHYFAAEPEVPDRQRTITVELAGRKDDVVVANGVFSPGRVDPGTAVLLREVELPHGVDFDGVNLLDLGCGWGPIALSLAVAAPAARVWAIDINQRALELSRLNARRLNLNNITASTPDQVPAGIRFAQIWSNPPIRIGKVALHQLLADWLPRLAPHGQAWLVVQKNLGSDSLAAWLRSDLGYQCERVASAKGYRVLRVAR